MDVFLLMFSLTDDRFPELVFLFFWCYFFLPIIGLLKGMHGSLFARSLEGKFCCKFKASFGLNNSVLQVPEAMLS